MAKRKRDRRPEWAAEYFGYRLLYGIGRLLPTASYVNGAAGLVSGLARMGVGRKRADANLAKIYPDWLPAKRRAVACGALANFARIGVEYMIVDRWCRRPPIAEVQGAEHVLAAAGRPILFATAHYGNWEAVRLAARDLGRQTGIVRRAFDNPWTDAAAFRTAESVGRPVIDKSPTAAREIFRCLRREGTLAMMIDQRESFSPRIAFMGHEAETPTHIATIAQRSRAVLIPARARRLVHNRNRFHIRFETPVPTENRKREAVMADLNACLEGWIAEAPEQWFWLHNRWRIGPCTKPRS